MSNIKRFAIIGLLYAIGVSVIFAIFGLSAYGIAGIAIVALCSAIALYREFLMYTNQERR